MLEFWLCISQQIILNEMGILDHIAIQELYAGQEATVRTGHWTIDWIKMGKRVHQGCIISPCLFNFYAEYIMWNARLDEAGIKTAVRNVNNLRYADDTTLMAESEEGLKSFLMKMKEESEKAVLKLNIKKKLNIQKTKIMTPSPINSCQIDGENMEIVSGFIFLGSKINVDDDRSHGIKRCCCHRIAMKKLGSVLRVETSLCWQSST